MSPGRSQYVPSDQTSNRCVGRGTPCEDICSQPARISRGHTAGFKLATQVTEVRCKYLHFSVRSLTRRHLTLLPTYLAVLDSLVPGLWSGAFCFAVFTGKNCSSLLRRWQGCKPEASKSIPDVTVQLALHQYGWPQEQKKNSDKTISKLDFRWAQTPEGCNLPVSSPLKNDVALPDGSLHLPRSSIVDFPSVDIRCHFLNEDEMAADRPWCSGHAYNALPAPSTPAGTSATTFTWAAACRRTSEWRLY